MTPNTEVAIDELTARRMYARKLATGMLHPGHEALEDLVQEGWYVLS